MVERTSDGVVIGRVGLWNPEGWFGVEVAWRLAVTHGSGLRDGGRDCRITLGFDHLDSIG